MVDRSQEEVIRSADLLWKPDALKKQWWFSRSSCKTSDALAADSFVTPGRWNMPQWSGDSFTCEAEADMLV